MPDVVKFDVLIIGGGIAGLSAALSLDQRFSVGIVTKGKIKQSSTWMAQGGIAVALGKDDSPELHFEDTMLAGHGLCDPAAVQVLVEEARPALEFLLDIGTEFDSADGEIRLALEGGHRRARVIHSGDATGSTIAASLGKEASRRSNVRLFDDCFVTNLVKQGDVVVGAAALGGAGQESRIFLARRILLATGGMGQVYLETTNPLAATGDGFAVAARAGSEMFGMEFVQFHPTALWADENPRFLISEAVRGDGAYLLDDTGERFMVGKHPLAELAPRDVVSSETTLIMEERDLSHVYLDARHLGGEYLATRFPRLYKECLEHHYDMGRDLVPVSPVAHYMIGGVKTDLDCATNLPGLYACGEVAYSGVHGANRLASNSLLEGLVFGRRFAKRANAELSSRRISVSDYDPPEEAPLLPLREREAGELIGELKKIMTESAWILRRESGLRSGLSACRRLWGILSEKRPAGRLAWEARNMVEVGMMVLTAALARRHSAGAHIRLDEKEPV